MTFLRGRSLGRPETTSVFLNLTSVSLCKQPSHPIATAPRETLNSTDLYLFRFIFEPLLSFLIRLYFDLVAKWPQNFGMCSVQLTPFLAIQPGNRYAFVFSSIPARHVLKEPLLIVAFALNSPVYAVSVCCSLARSAAP